MGKNVLVQYIRQPKYFKNFHCIGGSCLVSCCQYWKIDYAKDDVEKLKNAECSEALRKLIDSSFVISDNEESYYIKLNNENQCPFHNEEGLCSIQKELGEDYLSNTCISYPRRTMYSGDYILRSCAVSCPHALSLICSDEDSMILENVFPKKRSVGQATNYTEAAIISKPELKYRTVIFEFFYEILSDRSRSIETSIVLGAMAAQKLDEYIKQGKYDRIPDIIKALKPQINNPAQIEKLENVKPNLSLKANFSAGLIKLLKNSDVYANVFENGVPSEEKYNEGMKKFQEHFGGTEGFIRNITLNQYITNGMPFKKAQYSLFENYCYFVAGIAVFKFLVPAISINFEPVDEQVERAISIIDRRFTHNDVNFNIVLDYMKAFKCTSPAYLLGIIK